MLTYTHGKHLCGEVTLFYRASGDQHGGIRNQGDRCEEEEVNLQKSVSCKAGAE